jgi:O-methyltransferase
MSTMLGFTRSTVKKSLPRPLLLIYRLWQRKNVGDTLAGLRFLSTPTMAATLPARLRILERIYEANAGIECLHTQDEMLQVMSAILDAPSDLDGCVVEAGCFRGGSTAKLSVAAKVAGRRLVVFDSFEGLPDNTEQHQPTIFGDTPDFSKGRYSSALEQVRRNVATYGEDDICTYVKGWFEETMPTFSQPIVAAYLDVDLVSSTKTCIKHLYPLLQPGGILFSQDAHLPLIIDVLTDSRFWEGEIGCSKPVMEGLGRRKLIAIQKPLPNH